jgi:hypothetical protein
MKALLFGEKSVTESFWNAPPILVVPDGKVRPILVYQHFPQSRNCGTGRVDRASRTQSSR